MSLKDVIQFNEEHPTPEGYNQELLVMSEATDGIRNETYVQARDGNRDAAKQALDSVLVNYNLDAVVAPSDSRYESILDEQLKDSTITAYSLAAIAGYPSINVRNLNRNGNADPFIIITYCTILFKRYYILHLSVSFSKT